MSGELATGYSPQWLELRESADADARAVELLAPLRQRLPVGPRLVVRDLGCGTGSMGRWLAARLPGPQHWIMYDRDAGLLDHAATTMTGVSADGEPVTVATQRRDIATLTARDLSRTGLVTASALLDLLTAEEVNRLAAACVTAGCPALLTLSVTGLVELAPPDPLDPELTAAFNAHQRRVVDGRRLLGPQAVPAAAEAFTRLGAAVQLGASPWRLDAASAALTSHWLRGWVGAAIEQRPELAASSAEYLRRRLAQAQAGQLQVVVGHTDLLAYQG